VADQARAFESRQSRSGEAAATFRIYGRESNQRVRNLLSLFSLFLQNDLNPREREEQMPEVFLREAPPTPSVVRNPAP
jgi:hypothetical protein